MLFRLVPAVCLIALLAGCAGVERIGFYWNLQRASRAGDEFYEEHEPGVRDVSFTAISDVRLDVYSPDSGTGHPVLIFVHGGGWDKYDKKVFAPVAMQLVPRDLVVVIPDYTLYPDAGYEQMSREVAAAVDWTLENIGRYGGDPSRVVLSGHSAGGHLSGLVAFDERWLEDLGRSPDELRGWIGLSGVYDVEAQMAFERSTGGEAPVMTAVMGGEDNFAEASPATYVERPSAGSRSGEQPFSITLIHGGADDTVPISMTESLAARLAEADLGHELIIYPEEGHSSFLFKGLTDADARVLVDIAGALRNCR